MVSPVTDTDMPLPFVTTVPQFGMSSETDLSMHAPSNSSLGPEMMDYPTIRQPVHMIVIYSLAYSVVFLLGVTGNTLVVLIVYRNKRMHNITNYFIVNLAIADILVCILCLPITLLTNLFSGWRFGAVMCKATPFLQGVAVSASCSTLTAISIDRYLAICHTLEFRMTKRAARLAIAFIWSTAIGLMCPWAVYYQHIRWGNLYICKQVWPWQHMEEGYFLGAIFLACYSLPLILICICYTLIALRVWNRDAPGILNTSQAIYRSKVKVLKMLVVVVIMFAFSWLPLYASNMRLYFGPDLVDTSTEFVLLSQIILPIAQWLGSANSCVNPIIYCFFSKKFRKGFQDFIHCCKSRQRTYFTPTSSHYRTVHNGHSQYPLHVYSSVKVARGKDTTMLDQQEPDDTTCI